MITPPPGVQVYLACGYTDMRKGMATLAMLVQQTLGHDPFSGTIYAFRGRRGGLIKVSLARWCRHVPAARARSIPLAIRQHDRADRIIIGTVGSVA